MRGIVITEKFTDQTETLNRYLSDIKKEDLLTPDEEFELFIKYKESGCEKSKNKIITGNLRFVISVAKQYKTKNVELEDLISEGNKGLIEGVEKFDPYMGFKFISYAVWLIRKHIIIYLSDLSRTIKIPAKISGDMRKYQEFESSLAGKMGRNPSMEETMDFIEKNSDFILSKTAIESIKNSPVSVPLDPLRSSSGDEVYNPIDLIDSGDSADSVIIDAEKREMLEELISRLGIMEKEIVIMKFGLKTGFPMGYREIGESMERSSEWARLIGKKAINRMKHMARRYNLEIRI